MTGTLDIYRQGELLTTIDIDENTVFSDELPGTELITCPVMTPVAIDLQEEDYTIFEGNTYKIRILPDFGKDSSSLAKSYSINFLAKFYDLLDTYVDDEGDHVFTYYGTAADHLQLILDSANIKDPGWVIGEVDDTEAKSIDYDWTFVRPGLDMIGEAFGLEWKAAGQSVSMVKTIGRDTGIVFEFGRGKGLHKITRSSDNSKEKINRVYGVGGTRNIDASYREGTETNLVFEERFVETPGVTDGTERMRAGKYENLDIYPHFEGAVTAVSFVTDGEGKITSATITDPTIDFDLMAQLQPGVKAKVSFLTGPVTGVEFEISAFNYGTKVVTLIPFTDETGYYFPSDTSQPEVGNKFTFLDIRMPPAYIATWEAKLKAEAIIFLNDNKLQRLNYDAKPDEKELRGNNILLRAGDRATLRDTEMEVDEMLRFTKISFPLVNRFDVTGVIGNEIKYDKVVKLFADVQQAHQQIQQIDRRSEALAKRATQNLRAFELSVFNPDGKLDPSRLDVDVLTTILNIIGTKSQNFRLNKVYITDNFSGDANAVSISGGELVHFEFSNSGNQNVWQLQPLTQSGLTPASLYYVYCKCSKTSQNGTYVITTDQLQPEAVPGFWMFLAGVIYPVLDGYRDSDFTNGIADITGNRIKIGKIVSRDGLTGFDLDNNEIFGKITFRNSSGAVKNVADLEDDINNISVGGRNYFKRSTPIIDNGNSPQIIKYPELNGFILVGKPSLICSARLSDVLTSNGDWTLSFYVKNNVVNTSFTIDFADNTPVVVNSTPEYTYHEITVNITNYSSTYDFIDINGLDWLQFDFKDVKLEKGNKATDWSLAPEDLQADLDAAMADGAAALAELAEIADDSILDVSEKVKALQDNRIIEGNYAIRIPQANVYGVSTADYTTKYNALGAYLTPLFADMTVNSPIVRDTFIAKFKDVYNSETALLQAVTDAANGKITGKSYASGKMLYRDPEFAVGFNGISVYNNTGNGSVAIGRGTNADWGSALPNGSGFYVVISYSGAGASPGKGGFFFGTISRANAIYITRIKALIPVGHTIGFAQNSVGDGARTEWNTPVIGTGKWEEYIHTVYCGTSGTFSSTNFFFIDGPAGAANWYLASATVYDMTALETDPLAYADSKIAIARTTILADASFTSAGQATAAYNNALSAAGTDAQAKADAAYNGAVAVAESNRVALIQSLGSLAYQAIEQVAIAGQTLVQGGLIRTTLLDVAAIRAGTVTADAIQGLYINFVQGSIGGIYMSGSSIYSGNGNFSVDSSGNLYCTSANISGTINASSGSIGGFNISSGYMSSNADVNGDYFALNPSGRYIAFISTSNETFAGIGSNILPSATAVNAVGRFLTAKSNFGSTNIGIMVGAKNASTNIALDITDGFIRVAGQTGVNDSFTLSDNRTVTVISGIITRIGF